MLGLSGKAYLRLVLLGALIGIPAALMAAAFLAVVHAGENLLWDDLPDALGYASPPWFLVLGVPTGEVWSCWRHGGSSPATVDTPR